MEGTEEIPLDPPFSKGENRKRSQSGFAQGFAGAGPHGQALMDIQPLPDKSKEEP